ncbi:MAG TPA: DUF2460 domain-containing protein [Rhodoferax sp.]
MSDAIFPSNLPGLKWDIPREVSFKTSIYESLSGAERRIRHRPVPKHRIELSYEVLREQGYLTDLQTLRGFFMSRDGSFDSFLFHDPYDGQVTNLQFGIGDGVTTQFQLTRQIGTRSEVLHNPEATLAIGRVWFPSIGNDALFWPEPTGVWPATNEYTPPAGGWSLLANGLVQFTTPPPAGASLLWTGRYYYRARFADDAFSATEFMRRLFSNNKLAMVLSLQNIL